MSDQAYTSLKACPNDPPCGHFWHDIYEPGDPYPVCCHEDCHCGKPGEAVMTRHDDGTVTVDRADPVIRVSTALLDVIGPQHYNLVAMILTLDTAGEYRYEYLRPDPRFPESVIFGRIREATR